MAGESNAALASGCPCSFLGARSRISSQRHCAPGFQIIGKGRKISRLYSVRMCQQSSPGSKDVFHSVPEYVFPQNLDLPPVLPTNKKRPYVRPIKLVLRESRRRKKLGLIPHFWDAPRNGMLVERLIPVAYEVMKQLGILEEGVKKLMEVVPVQACSCCKDIHVGASGHLIRTCKGSGCASRRGAHAWIKAYPPDVLVPTECYHILDRLASPIIHEQRFSVPRLCAITELCIQAGYEHPDYPVVRWARISGRQVGSGRAQVAESRLLKPYTGFPGDSGHTAGRKDSTKEGRFVRKMLRPGTDNTIFGEPNEAEDGDEELETTNREEDEEEEEDQVGGIEEEAQGSEESFLEGRVFDPARDEIVATAERTIEAFHTVRKGIQLMMKKYVVKACGYCPEIHVGPRGHRVKICGAFKHQQRDGKHGWQEAALSDIFPPNFVWHVPSGHSPALRPELRRYYGQAPAVVELCVQAGARVPVKWKPFMRSDVVIPDVEEKSVVC
ncbi:APO protein 1, chloroplastic [Selaginella moellendorffii]|uniref:APO protein 1, chloroplastic n=1 Tax=Selaginella moellendorffii TaxID=88036 RepID=UPI000D1CA921|nr:APO protein 1, chloroplastic [Selaginella moellendorffii]|eukprot:XP_024536804.1 APO protein 1, chloroplastic [Selaginella moellendorffii]